MISLPAPTTSPATSSPGMSVTPGGGGYAPFRCSTSGRLTPAAATRISTSFGRGTGTGRETARRTSGGPGVPISMAVMCKASLKVPHVRSLQVLILAHLLRAVPAAMAAVFLTQPLTLLRRQALPAMMPAPVPPVPMMAAQSAEENAAQHQEPGRLQIMQRRRAEQARQQRVPQQHDDPAEHRHADDEQPGKREPLPNPTKASHNSLLTSE